MNTPTELPLAGCAFPRSRLAVPLRFTLGLVAAVVCLAAGCGAARPSKYYQLTVPPNSAASENANTLPITLLIGRITAPSIYREEQIVYSSHGESMGTYEYEKWAEPPTEMIAEILLRQFRASGHYHGVYALRSDIRGDFLLHGHLYDFRDVEGGSVVGRVTLELEMRDIKTATVVWTHFYTHDEPAGGKDISSIVAALDKNIQQGVAEFRASLDQYFTEHPPAHPAPKP